MTTDHAKKLWDTDLEGPRTMIAPDPRRRALATMPPPHPGAGANGHQRRSSVPPLRTLPARQAPASEAPAHLATTAHRLEESATDPQMEAPAPLSERPTLPPVAAAPVIPRPAGLPTFPSKPPPLPSARPASNEDDKRRSGIRAKSSVATSASAPRPSAIAPSAMPRPSSIPPARPASAAPRVATPPPTVITRLDDLFARDKPKRSAPPPPPRAPMRVPSATETAHGAAQLLSQVVHDFGTLPPPAPAPQQVAFMPTPSAPDAFAPSSDPFTVPAFQSGAELNAADQAELDALAPWPVRLWRSLFK